MKNYLSCLTARKGATVAAAALVTLAVGFGARALADDGIQVLGDSEPGIEAAQGEASSDGPQYENHGGSGQGLNYGQDGAGDGQGDDTPADDDGAQDAPAATIEGLRYQADGGGWADAPACAPLDDALGKGRLTGGWYALDGGEDYLVHGKAYVDRTVEVTGEVNVVLRNAVLRLGEGARLHVAKGATLNVYTGHHGRPVAAIDGKGADTLIDNEGTVELRGVWLNDAKDCAVRSHAGARLTLVDANIMNCGGDAVCAEDGATTVLDGTYVRNNGGYAVSGGEVHVAGHVSVTDNAKGNVRYERGTRIIVDRTLEDGTRIGVAREAGAEGPITSGFFSAKRDPLNIVSGLIGSGPANAARFFFCDDGWPVVYRWGEAAYDRPISFLDESGKAAEVPASKSTDISDGAFKDYGGFKLGDGFYVVSSDRTFKERPNVVGDAKIILCDGATATFNKGIRCEKGRLTIYAQSTSKNRGALIAKGVDEGAGIGGGKGESNRSEIVICGGHIDATGHDYGAGIGGGNHGGCGTIRILGGRVVARGADRTNGWFYYGGGAGIGSGDAAKEGGTVEISGGTVAAHGGHRAAGIGCGCAGKAVDVTITGGTVGDSGGGCAAGIGSGAVSESGTIRITGTGRTTVDAHGGNNDGKYGFSGAGIGGGEATDGGNIYIHGDVIVNAQGGCDWDFNRGGAGIGGGCNGDSGVIDIEVTGDGEVKGVGGCSAAGIGAGTNGKAGTIGNKGGIGIDNLGRDTRKYGNADMG